jgi:hypothetical protein
LGKVWVEIRDGTQQAEAASHHHVTIGHGIINAVATLSHEIASGAGDSQVPLILSQHHGLGVKDSCPMTLIVKDITVCQGAGRQGLNEIIQPLASYLTRMVLEYTAD